VTVPRARVIVTTYEQVRHLRRGLRGYLRQTVRDFSLVVADDGSGPETRGFLEEFAAEAASRGIPFEHCWQEDRGFRRAHIQNEAVRRGGGEDLLIFSDGDCIPPAHFVERHLRAHEPLSFQVAGGVRLTREVSEGITEADVDSGRFEALITPANRRELARRARRSRWGVRMRRRNRPKIVGLNVAVDRRLFEALNGFDERFVGWGLEDSDLRDRAMRYRPRVRVKILYGCNDVFHLWHELDDSVRETNRAYYDTPRPVRCELGLERPG
jgi:glycosyltransferase involved in cell wall biosynthesis